MYQMLQHPVITRLREYGYDIEPQYCEICGRLLDDDDDCEVNIYGGYICPECCEERCEDF